MIFRFMIWAPQLWWYWNIKHRKNNRFGVKYIVQLWTRLGTCGIYIWKKWVMDGSGVQKRGLTGAGDLGVFSVCCVLNTVVSIHTRGQVVLSGVSKGRCIIVIIFLDPFSLLLRQHLRAKTLSKVQLLQPVFCSHSLPHSLHSVQQTPRWPRTSRNSPW